MATVLVVEDDPRMCDFFKASVSRCAGLSLLAGVGTVTDAKNWLSSGSNAVDVLLVDLGLPDGSGLDLIRYAIAYNPRCEPLVISMFGDDVNVLACIEAGALGYIHKDAVVDDIGRSILEMLAGASPISPLIARRVLYKYRYVHCNEISKADNKPEKSLAITENQVPEKEQAQVLLSQREQDVLSLISRGYTYAEVARLECLSVRTIQTHIKNVYAKLSVHSKTEAVFEGSRLGLLQAR